MQRIGEPSWVPELKRRINSMLAATQNEDVFVEPIWALTGLLNDLVVKYPGRGHIVHELYGCYETASCIFRWLQKEFKKMCSDQYSEYACDKYTKFAKLSPHELAVFRESYFHRVVFKLMLFNLSTERGASELRKYLNRRYRQFRDSEKLENLVKWLVRAYPSSAKEVISDLVFDVL